MNTLHPLHLDNTSHVVALVTTTLLNPSRPEQSQIFDRAALIQKTTGCKVTVLHTTEHSTHKRDMEERIAFKVLVQRANNYFDVNFDSHLEIGQRNLNGIERAFKKLDGHLMLKQNPGEPGDRTDTTGINLLESATFPVWFVNSQSPIEEISARVNGAYAIREDDVLTCHVARDLGTHFDSDVQVLQSRPKGRREHDAGDLVVTCVPGPNKCPDDILNSLRRDAASMLEAPVEFDLLVHRGCDGLELTRAA